jgi:hypothetical protein
MDSRDGYTWTATDGLKAGVPSLGVITPSTNLSGSSRKRSKQEGRRSGNARRLRRAKKVRLSFPFDYAVEAEDRLDSHRRPSSSSSSKPTPLANRSVEEVSASVALDEVSPSGGTVRNSKGRFSKKTKGKGKEIVRHTTSTSTTSISGPHTPSTPSPHTASTSRPHTASSTSSHTVSSAPPALFVPTDGEKVAIKFKYTPAVDSTERLGQLGKEFDLAIEIGHSVLQVRTAPVRNARTANRSLT